jgi:putative thioredoxin
MNAASHVIEVSIENFQSEVAEKSKQVPVLLEFYADSAEPSQQLAPVLRRLADEYQGKFLLARVDIQQNQQLVQQLGVRTLPTLKIVFQGQMVENLEGQIEEARLRQVLDQVTMSPLERVREQLAVFLADGDRHNAIEMLKQVIEGEPKNYVLQTELCDLLILEGRADEAKQILAGLPPDCEGISKPRNRLDFLDAASPLDTVAELTSQMQADTENLQLRLDLATVLVADDQIEPALEQLLDILKKDREWQDQVARKTMIRIFELLGKGDELATAYRRKMFTFLH